MNSSETLSRSEHSQDDFTLLERAQAGDADALGDLYMRHRRIITFAADRVVGREHAEDIAQEAYISAHRNIGKFAINPERQHSEDDPTGVRNWMASLARNRGIDRVRQRQTQLTLASENVQEEFERITASPERSPEDIAVDSIDLQRALETLSEGQRDAVLAIHYEGKTHPEYAEESGNATGTNKTHVHRGLKRLRNVLSEGESINLN